MLPLETNDTPYFSVLVTFFQPDGFACIFLEELIITDEEDCFLSFLKKKKSKKQNKKRNKERLFPILVLCVLILGTSMCMVTSSLSV